MAMKSQADKSKVKAFKIKEIKKIRDAYLAAKKADVVKKYRIYPIQ